MLAFEGKNIIILGGSGTLGRAILRELFASESAPGKVIIYSRDEIKQLEMIDEFDGGYYSCVDYALGDVRDSERLNKMIKGVDYVIHAAAIKHVVMAEMNPEECWKTNVVGTGNVIESCTTHPVERALLISTDKAVNPAGVYGQSKQKAEELWMAANNQHPGRFGIVRFGNIIGARGSVFEAFERQRKTGIIKVTHPEATRFCISQEKAAQFVLTSLSDESCHMAIPEMDAFNVMDLAKEVAPECEIEIVGLRPGDKLHEEINGVSSRERVTEKNSI